MKSEMKVYPILGLSLVYSALTWVPLLSFLKHAAVFNAFICVGRKD